jgi:hypothetical protein
LLAGQILLTAEDRASWNGKMAKISRTPILLWSALLIVSLSAIFLSSEPDESARDLLVPLLVEFVFVLMVVVAIAAIPVSPLLIPVIIVICAAGAYTVHEARGDITAMLVFGLIGYVFRKLNYPLVPLIVAIMFGDMAESSFRESMLVSAGDVSIFWSSWLVTGLMALAVLMLISRIILALLGRLNGGGKPVAT